MGAGWAIAVFEQGPKRIEMTASYLHDSLEELTKAAIALQKGCKQAVIVFMDEPGEHQVYIQNEEGVLEIGVRWYSDWASWYIGTTQYKVVEQFTTSVSRFRHQVLEVLNALYVSPGPEGYKEQWNRHDFPMDGYHRLAAYASPRRYCD